jgi:hypothetical protein
MRKFFLVGLVVAMVVAVAAMAAEMPGKITIKDCADTKTPVTFDHAAHVKVAKDCVKCHHTQKDLTAANAATVAIEKCGKCHIKPEKPETPACSGKKPTDRKPLPPTPPRRPRRCARAAIRRPARSCGPDVR